MFETTNLPEHAPSKAELTRERLYQAAVKLFSKNGFEGTNMRAVAKEAGIALGATYYHFESKESIVFEYYTRIHNDHLVELGEFLSKEKDFSKRLHKVVTSKIESSLPEKGLAHALFRVAADPTNPLSPFSKQSKVLRDESVGIFRDVVNGSKDAFHPEIRKILPKYLWLYQMGLILFWIFDNSKNSKKTFDLIDKTVPLIVFLNAKISSPLAAPIRKRILATLESFVPNFDEIQNQETQS